jgi:hypothetical protein
MKAVENTSKLLFMVLGIVWPPTNASAVGNQYEPHQVTKVSYPPTSTLHYQGNYICK